MECLSYNIAKQFDLNRLEAHIKSDVNFSAKRQWGALLLHAKDADKHLCFIFANGSIVTWGYKRHAIAALLDYVMPFCNNPHTHTIHDWFSAQQGLSTTLKPHRYYDVDILTVTDWDHDLLLALSYGLSQSIKLQYFEHRLETLIEHYTPYANQLAQKGEMPLTRRASRKIIGEILGAKSELNLTSNFLYQPKYFWSHPTLEAHFAMAERYLDLPKRAETLNHRLDTLNEVFDMFHAYLEGRHSHVLEIIIIVLIAVEIVFNVLNLHF